MGYPFHIHSSMLHGKMVQGANYDKGACLADYILFVYGMRHVLYG